MKLPNVLRHDDSVLWLLFELGFGRLRFYWLRLRRSIIEVDAAVTVSRPGRQGRLRHVVAVRQLRPIATGRHRDCSRFTYFGEAAVRKSVIRRDLAHGFSPN